jgi:hypothetical protein
MDYQTSAMLAWIARQVVGVMFLLAGVSKMRDAQAFSDAMVQYEVVSEPAARRVAPLVVAAEVVVGVWMLSGLVPGAAGTVSLTLLAVFGYAMGVNLHRGRRIPCHCFGMSTRGLIGPASVARLGVLAVFSGAVTVVPGSVTMAGLVPAGVGAADAVALAVSVAAMSTLVLLIAPVMETWRRCVWVRRLERLGTHGCTSGRSAAPMSAEAGDRASMLREESGA